MASEVTRSLEEVPTVDLLTELKRRYRVLQRPEGSVVLLGPPGAGKKTQAQFIRQEFGLCSVDGEKLKTENGGDLMETLKKISAQLEQPRCRRGFVLSGFPGTAEEATAFEKMLTVDFPDVTTFSDFKVVELNTPTAEPKILQERATDKENFPTRVANWLSARKSLVAQLPRFARLKEVDVSKSAEEVSRDILDFLNSPSTKP